MDRQRRSVRQMQAGTIGASQALQEIERQSRVVTAILAASELRQDSQISRQAV